MEIVCREDIPTNSNILNERFVSAIQDEGTAKEVRKARFVVQVHKDSIKQSLVHNTSVPGQRSIKLIVGAAAIFDFQLYSSDVAQAHLQCLEQLTRDIYQSLSEEIYLKSNLSSDLNRCMDYQKVMIAGNGHSENILKPH